MEYQDNTQSVFNYLNIIQLEAAAIVTKMADEMFSSLRGDKG